MPLSNDPSGPPGGASSEPLTHPAAPGLRFRRHRVANAPGTIDAGRTLLVVEVVDELTSWNAKEREKAFRRWLKGSLSLIHLHVLTVLESEGPMPMSKLADTLDVSVASATGIVSRMEERGLVERRHDQADRRVVLVVPTESGLAVFRDMMAARREHLTGVLARLSDEELESFLVGLRAVRAARAAVHAETDAARERDEDGEPDGAGEPGEDRR